MNARLLPLLGLLALPPHATAADILPAPTGLQRSVTFTEYSAFSRDTEILRRLGSPLMLRRVQQVHEQSGLTLRQQDVDLSREKFALYVPDEAPPQGYGLLVFVMPFQEGFLPRQWKPALDRHGMIFVTAANSGNETSVIERRIPLALLGMQNVIDRYKVDPERVYIGGLSGGSRVAQSIALAYPDLFRAALLEAGSDPITKHATIPSADLFRRFQEKMRLVYFTGEFDDTNRSTDAVSRQSMEDWCVFDIYSLMIPEARHVLADFSSFNQALDELARHEPADQGRLDACRAKIDAQINAKLQEIQDLIASRKIDEARSSLKAIDERYGGLLAPRSLELAEKLDAIR